MRPKPIESSQTYTVDIQGKIYQRTREHLRLRSKNKVVTLTNGDPIPVLTDAPTHKPTDAPEAKVISTTPPIGDRTDLKGNLLTLNKPLSAQLPCSPMRLSSQPVNTAATIGTPCYKPKSQVTRSERVAQIPTHLKTYEEPRKKCLIFKQSYC